jgi:cobyrinic acid a,c-diamide synthase
VRGHEFHRTTATPDAGATPAWHWSGPDGATAEGFAVASVHASYLHLNWAGSPRMALRFVSSCAIAAADRSEHHAHR